MVPIAINLAKTCRVYAPDLPAFRLSAKPPRVLDVRALADALAAWMRAAGLVRPALLGNSFGCQIIADLGVRHRVDRARCAAGPTMDPRAQAGLTRCTPSGCPQIPGVVGAARLYRDEDMTISGRPL